MKCKAEKLTFSTVKNTGFGSLVNGLTKPFMLALDRGQTFVTPHLGMFVDGAGCIAATKKRLAELPEVLTKPAPRWWNVPAMQRPQAEECPPRVRNHLTGTIRAIGYFWDSEIVEVCGAP